MPTASPLARFFGAFEGTRSAYPVALFRVAFFGGLALHFFPSLVHLDDNYAAGVLRTDEWSQFIYDHLHDVPHSTLRVWSIVTMLACGMGILGLLPRLAAVVAGVGCYVFASFNGLPVQTLALVDAWGVLSAWMLCGGGSEAWSLDAILRAREGHAAPPRAPKLLSALVLYQVLLAVFFAGVEKILAGWPWTNEMGVVLSYPKGFIVRDWVASTPWLHASAVTHAFTWFTLVVELGCPPVFLFGRPRARVVALVVYEAFFLGIIAMLEVPPLFYFIFAFGALLVLDDAQVAWLAARLRRSGRSA